MKKLMIAANKRRLKDVLKRRGVKVTSIRVIKRANKNSDGRYMVTSPKFPPAAGGLDRRYKSNLLW